VSVTPKQLVGLCLAAVTTVVGLDGASGHSPYKRWSSHMGPLAKAGVCGRVLNSQGGPVAFWQSILWAGGQFIGTSSIDASFGNSTHTNTQDWQKAHGLEADGCVGPNTLYTAQYSTAHGGHMAFLGSSTQCEGGAYCWTNEDWKYQDGYDDRSLAMSYDTHCAGGWYVQRPLGTIWYAGYSHNC
jgi:peptidoglycan hydrolase-like protein with peptidoglycan-binding domain